MITTITEEYIAPDSSLALMLEHLHGWWRFKWRWYDKSAGLVLPSLKLALAHRKYCDAKYWDKIGFGITLWRLFLCFDCQTMVESREHYREMFSDDIWPTLVVDEVLDAEVIG